MGKVCPFAVQLSPLPRSFIPPLTLSPLVNHLYYYLRSKYRGSETAKEVVAM